MLNKLTLFGCASLLLSALVKADPFTSEAQSKGKIETGYGANDAAFMKHRPRYHILPPVNWMNDPSSLYYDGQNYHVYYQHNPYDYVWGNMTWGHAISKDLLKWEDKPFSLYPDIPENKAGAFDGSSLIKKGYQGYPTLIYTAVNTLATPYQPGAEQQILAITKDNGDTWENIQLVIDKSKIPFNLPVGGFRDPFPFRSSSFDDLLGLQPKNDNEDSIYLTISSSVVGKGGRLWLYHSKNWLDWELRGPIVSHPVNYTSNPTYFGSDGDNFEVASYFEIPDPAGGNNFHVLTYGTERGRDDHFAHWSVYVAGQELEIIQPDGVETGQPTPRVKETITGVIDWGLLYAVLKFDDSKNNRPLSLGWVQDDLIDPKKNPARWNGVMGLFRETFIQTVEHVSPNDPLLKKAENTVIYDEKSRSVRLMGTRPMKDYEQIRDQKWSLDVKSKKKTTDFSNYKIPVDSKYIEIDATFKIKSKNSGALGIVVRQSDTQETVINYIPNQGNIYINRTLSTSNKDLYRVTPEIAPLPLFQINTPNSDHSNSAADQFEDLNLRIFVDNSMLEVFANERLAISTRIYPDENANGLSIRIPDDVTVSNFDVYGITFAAFDRP